VAEFPEKYLENHALIYTSKTKIGKTQPRNKTGITWCYQSKIKYEPLILALKVNELDLSFLTPLDLMMRYFMSPVN
jgi:hypothetical protein